MGTVSFRVPPVAPTRIVASDPQQPSAGPSPTAASLERGRGLFNAGKFFEAHEIWEEAWRSEPEPTRKLLQGLIQITAGFHKGVTLRQPAGCVRLLEAGLLKLDAGRETLPGLSLAAFKDEVSRSLAEARRWLMGERGDLDDGCVPRLETETSVKSRRAPGAVMPFANLPWNCPNPYCEDPHNESSTPVEGVIRCHSCGWQRRVTAPEPESLDDLPGLFQPRADRDDEKPDK